MERISSLKKVYVARGPGDAHLLRGLLESEEIDVVIRGDGFVPLQGGGLFHVETCPSIWVLDDHRFSRALEIIDEYVCRGVEEDVQTVNETWRCLSCGESIELHFTSCWKCGQERMP
jgi:hypothetical protein